MHAAVQCVLVVLREASIDLLRAVVLAENLIAVREARFRFSVAAEPGERRVGNPRIAGVIYLGEFQLTHIAGVDIPQS